MKLLVTGGAGFIGSTYVRRHLAEHPERRDRRPRQAHLRRAAARTSRGRTTARLDFRRGRHRRPRGRRRRDRGLRRGRQLRRRVARRPLDRGPGRLHPDRRLRHLRPARGRARRRHPPPADLHRRGLRLDRRGLLHRGVPDRALLALLGLEGRRRPDRRRLPAHLRRRRADRPRLQQLRPAPAPREADPAHASSTRSPATRCPSTATGCRSATGSSPRTSPPRSTSSSSAARPGEVYNVGGPEELPNIEVDQADPRADRPRRVADRPRRGPARPRPPLLARLRAHRGARLERRRSASTRGSSARSPGTATTRTGGGRSARASTASTTSASTGASSAVREPSAVETKLDGLVAIEPRVFGDDRGFLLETYSADRWRELGVDGARSSRRTTRARPQKGTLRGLHFQTEPGPGQARPLPARRDLRRRRRPAARLADVRPVGGARARRRDPPPALGPGRLRPRLPGAERGRRRRLQADLALRPRDRERRSPGTTPTSGSSGRSPIRCSRSATGPRRGSPRSPTSCRSELRSPRRATSVRETD